jgi:UDP:flavonoid glycosyltransferase YjiC (YdhE family)
MHMILATMGTDGDIIPYLGLGAVLRGRGHRVTLAAPETYRERALRLGLEFCAIVTAAETARMLADPDLWHPFRSGVMMARWGGPMIARQYDAIANLISSESESVLVANPGVLSARLAQETLGVPLATLLLQPGLIPSCIAPPEMPGGATLPRWLPHPLRPLYWLAVDSVGYALVAPSLNEFRKRLGLPPVRRVFRWWLSPQLVIGLFPSWYAAPPLDWPAQLRLAGFASFDGTDEPLPDEVKTFCDKGPPPIAFTLGTGMAYADSFFRTAVEACEALGARGLLLTKFLQVLPAGLPQGVRHCAFAPFRKLLPRCAALVHHGGIGTTAAALESGCPQLVLPLAWDQPDNAARVVRLGAGIALGPRRRSREDVVRALAELATADFRNRCRGIAGSARAADGLANAAQWVENLGGG